MSWPRPIEYLAHYANRVAMSNSRLLAIENDSVLFHYKDLPSWA